MTRTTPGDLLAVHGGQPVRTAPLPTWPISTPAVEHALLAVARSGHWWQSGHGRAEALEERLAQETGAARVVAVANGTTALEVGLRAAQIGYGDEVLVPAVTFVSSASAVLAVGATPVPVDVCPHTLTMDPTSAENAVGPATRAVMAVHLAGQPADVVALRRLCDRHGLLLVEDSAQAHAARRDGHRVAQVGDLATFSFQAAKLVSAGDGGAVVIPRDRALARAVERVANCGRPRGSGDYDHTMPAVNARISEFNAAVALAQLDGVDDWWSRRCEGAERLLRTAPAGAVLGPVPTCDRHDWYMVMLRATPGTQGTSGPTTARLLSAEGLPTRRLYPVWSDLEGFAHLPRDERFESVAVARRAAREVVWLHHALLLDPSGPEDLAAGLRKLDAAGRGVTR